MQNCLIACRNTFLNRSPDHYKYDPFHKATLGQVEEQELKRTTQFVEEHQPLSVLSSKIGCHGNCSWNGKPNFSCILRFTILFLKQISALSQNQRTNPRFQLMVSDQRIGF